MKNLFRNFRWSFALFVFFLVCLLFYQLFSIKVVLETKTILAEPKRYVAWPTIEKLSTGELIVVFSGDRDAHIDPFGVTQMIRSDDEGRTWSSPTTINNTPLDDRDAAILETSKGTLLVSWFTSLAFDRPKYFKKSPHWKKHTRKLSSKDKRYWLASWTRRSIDGGKSWELPIKQHFSSPHGAIELLDGRLLHVGTSTNRTSTDKKILGVESSNDDGKKWNVIATIKIPSNELINNYSEPNVIEVGNKLIVFIRYEPKDNKQSFLRRSESLDGGKSWSVARKTNIWGYPPHILKLKNNWLVLTYGYRRKPYGIRASISKDGGNTWGKEYILSKGINHDLGYPSSVQLDDGSILTVYYQVDKIGELPAIKSTRWRLTR